VKTESRQRQGFINVLSSISAEAYRKSFFSIIPLPSGIHPCVVVGGKAFCVTSTQHFPDIALLKGKGVFVISL
jgi:hypothetical protein